jgi:hypothetical protein
MVAQPRLFLQSLAAAQETQADSQVRDGPEGQWERDLYHLQAVVRRLQVALPQIVASEGFADSLCRLRTTLAGFVHHLARSLDHDPDCHPRRRPHPACPEPEPARHQSCAEALA